MFFCHIGFNKNHMETGVFDNCDFLLGESDSIVVIVPQSLPKDMPLVIEVHRNGLVFLSGEDLLGEVPCSRMEVLQRLVSKAKVGLVEFLQGAQQFPAYISAVASVEVKIEAAA